MISVTAPFPLLIFICCNFLSASSFDWNSTATDSKTPSSVGTIEYDSQHVANGSSRSSFVETQTAVTVDRWPPRAPEILYVTITLIIGACGRAIFKAFHHYINVPYPLFVILVGCIYGAVLPNDSYFIKLSGALPDTIMLIFFPIMIYEAAYSMQTHLFYKLFPHMIIIGTVGTAIAVAAVAGLSELIIGWGWQASIIFSAIVSACDPVAAIMIIKESGNYVKSVNMVLEGTCLMSDASAIVLNNLFTQYAIDMDTSIPALTELHVSGAEKVGRIFQKLLGGPAWGLLVGFGTTTVLSHMSNMWEAEVLLIISAPYITFWCADVPFEISGALALVVLGLWMSAHRASMATEVEELMHKIWEIMSIGVDTLVFSLFGILLFQKAKTDVSAADWGYMVALSIVIYLVRGLVFAMLQPILHKIGMGKKVFTWPHIFVLVWGGFRGALTLLLGMNKNQYLEAAKGVIGDQSSRIAFYSAGVVGFGLIINASTFRFFLKKLGLLEMPLSKLISINMAMDSLRQMRRIQLERMSSDRRLSDADWAMVEEASKLESKFKIKESDEEALWAVYYITSEAQQIEQSEKSGQPVRLPTAEELEEMEAVARLRIIKAKKSSYWRQFEEGSVSQRGLEELEDLADQILLEDRGIIGADDIKEYLRDNRWTGLKDRTATLLTLVNRRKSLAVSIPKGNFRRWCLRIISYPFFELFMYSMLTLNLIDTILDFTLTGWDYSEGLETDIVLYVDLVFVVIYTIEAVLKLSGLGFKRYWGEGIVNWNRIDLLVLILSWLDIILCLVAQYAVTENQVTFNTISRIFTIMRLVRFFRMVRVLRPLIPHILNFLDQRVNSHLFFAYDIARAFMVGQAEADMLIPILIGYKPLVQKLRAQGETDDRIIARELGYLNEERPDVAAAVKTRQASRSVLNQMHKTVMEMRERGIIDDDDAQHLRGELEEKLKKLRHFPHSIVLNNDRDRIWNVPWIHGNRDIFDAVKLMAKEMSFDRGTEFLTAGAPPDGLYFVTNGVVTIHYPKAHSDHPQLGEIYNSDNLEASFDDELIDAPLKNDFILAGTMMNMQSVVVHFNRRSTAICETNTTVLFIEPIPLFKAMVTLPAMEVRIWRRVSVCVALNLVIKMGLLVDSDTTVEDESVRLSRGAVRLVRPGVQLTGLEVFPEIFLICGVVKGSSTGQQQTFKAPWKLDSSVKEVTIESGRPAVKDLNGNVVYPEYAVVLLLPPGGQDISTLNVHDSQTVMVADTGTADAAATSLSPRKTAVSATETGSNRRQSNAAGLIKFANMEDKKKSQNAYSELVTKQIRRSSKAV